MPITGRDSEAEPLDSVIRSLNQKDRVRVAALVRELRSRGKEVPADLIPQRRPWPVDPDGYFVKMSGKRYTPSDNQRGFVESTSYFVGFYGSRGSGKSSGGAQKALRKIKEGFNGAVMNPDFENLKISTWPEFREWIPWEMVVQSQRYRKNPEWQPSGPFIMAFTNGVRVTVKGVKDPDSARGPNINWLWYDEAQRDTDGGAWKTAVASVRVGRNPQAWATFTPAGTDHWTTDFFVEKKIPEEVMELLTRAGYSGNLIETFHGTMNENKNNLDPGFMAAMLMAYPAGWLRQQEIYGEVVEHGGVLGDRSWFNGHILSSVPGDVVIKSRVRYWDLAATEKKVSGRKANDPDETVGSLISWDGTNFYIENQVSGFWEWEKIKDEILRVRQIDGPFVKTFVEQEPGAGGKNQVAELITFINSQLPGFAQLEGHSPEGDKVMRANVWFSEAAKGLVYVVAGEWTNAFFDQLGCFPMCRHDDKIDSVSGARLCVAHIRKWKKVDFLHL